LPFKGWLAKQHGFTFDEDAIRAAARMLDTLHPDLVELAKALQSFTTD
jgi:hypothetical protein